MGVKRGSTLEGPGWKIAQHSPNVHEVIFPNITAGWEQWVLLSSDRHHDNVDTRWDIEKKHLDDALKRKALILDFGDLFCAMQGKWDPRSSKDKCRPEHQVPNYLDALVTTAADFYAPYSKLFGVIARGNHETKIIDRAGTDLVGNLVHGLNNRGGNCYAGGYGGWVNFQFQMSTNRKSKRLKYFHGSGGGGYATRGTLDIGKQLAYIESADIIINGHSHDAWYVPVKREHLSSSLVIEKDIVHFVRTPGYKDEYASGASGWWVETGKSPRPLGCAWLRFSYNSTDHSIDSQITMDVE